MRIGLVLPSTPGYSETFFTNKIRGLKAEGYEVILFVGAKKRIGFQEAKVYYGPFLSENVLSKFIVSSFSVLKVVSQAPSVSIRFLRLEINSGSSVLEAVRRLVICSHILPHKLEWLHFGFATMGIDRELVGKTIRARLAVSFRGYDISVYPIKHKGCYKRLFSHIDKVHTISDDLLDIAYRTGLPKTIPVVKITPAINTKIFTNIRQSFFTGETINIVTIARLHWKKGLEYTLEALSKLKEDGVSFRYRIIGEGSEFERLVFARHQLGLQDYVEFSGKISHNEIPGILKEGDIYLQYSLQEGFCNAVLEAQAAGMLCIVSDAEGLSENVIDGQTGWVVPKRRPDLLVQKILEVINMPKDEILMISRRAAERVKSEFSLEKQRKEFIAFYKE